MLLAPVVLQGALDGVASQHAAMQLHWRQTQLVGNLLVLYFACLVDMQAPDLLGDQRRRRNCRAAAKGLELCVCDEAVLVDLDAELHDVAAGRGAHEAGADAFQGAVEAADVARVVEVVNDVVVVFAGESEHLARGMGKHGKAGTGIPRFHGVDKCRSRSAQGQITDTSW